jgi:hypothetical protein
MAEILSMEALLASLRETGRRPDGLTGLEDVVRDLTDYLRSVYGPPCARMVVIHGPPGAGKTSVAEVCLARAGFTVHRPLSAAPARDVIRSAVDFSLSAGGHYCLTGGVRPAGKAILVDDVLSVGAKHSPASMLAEIRAALLPRQAPLRPVVLIACSNGLPGKTSEVGKVMEVAFAVSHPPPEACAARLTAMFPAIPRIRVVEACRRAEGGGMVASITALFACDDGTEAARSGAPPMYASFFERVRWAMRASSRPPDASTFRAVHGAISNEPALAAMILRDTNCPSDASGATPEARLAYMRASDGVELFRGNEGLASEVAAAAFELMALRTNPEAEIRFPGSYSVASARSACATRAAATAKLRPGAIGGCNPPALTAPTLQDSFP